MRTGIGWLWVLIMAGFAVLGLMWWSDQRRDWESPRWEPERFVPILTSRGADNRPPRVVAVQPRCPSCLAGLEREAAHRPLLDSRRLVALIVAVDEVWWDAEGVWRHRWGRRVYGETYDFDRLGRLTGSGHVLKPVDQ